MCKYCLKPICPSGCPNAEEVPIVEECEYCKEGAGSRETLAAAANVA